MKAKISWVRSGWVLATAAAIHFSSLSAYAISTREALKEAYAALAVANHSYDGHRGKAMDHVQAAGKALGIRLEGDAKGKEKKDESDRYLRYARDMLQQARTSLLDKNKDDKDRKNERRALDEVNGAIHEIDAAVK